MNIYFKILKVVLGIAFLCALPFIIEWGLSAYEFSYDPRTQLGAITTDGGPVKEGLNRRYYQEIRFRSTGMKMYFSAKNLSEAKADLLADSITGRFRVLKEEEELFTYDFKLEQVIKKDVGGLDNFGDTSSLGDLSLAKRFDVDCQIVPATEVDQKVAKAFYQRQFEKGEQVEFAYVFEGEIPPESQLGYSYSKCPRSLLRGTFLEQIDRAIKKK